MKRVLAFIGGNTHPSSRLRVTAYTNDFKKLGWSLNVHAFDSGMGKALSKSVSPLTRGFRRLRRAWRTYQAANALRRWGGTDPIIISRELPVNRTAFLQSPNPIILDVDDALYLGQGRGRLIELCRRADAVVCGNESIAAELSSVSKRCAVIPTVVDTGIYSVRTNHDVNGPLRIGWLGSSMSIEETLVPWIDTLATIRKAVPFDLVIVSDELPAPLTAFSWVRFLKWSPAVEQSIANHMDVGIMPLADNPYQRAKCGAKLIQYMAAGLPVIASPVGANRDIVTHGQNGFLAATPDEWKQSIQKLSENELRSTFGRVGRERAERHYSTSRWAPEWAALLEKVGRS